jgi:hypothetical protein
MAISPVASAEGRGIAAGLRRELGNWNFCFGRTFAVPGRCWKAGVLLNPTTFTLFLRRRVEAVHAPSTG